MTRRSPPASRRGRAKLYLRVILETLQVAKPTGETNLAATFNDLAESMKPTGGTVIVLSDLFFERYLKSVRQAGGAKELLKPSATCG